MIAKDNHQLLIDFYEGTGLKPSQRYRWRIISAFNGKKMSNGGEGYSSPSKRFDALQTLYPTKESCKHILVQGQQQMTLANFLGY